ncbi:hypothetical protein [Sulfurimonas sp.]
MKIFTITLFLGTFVFAQTSFVLTKFKSVYPLVKIHTQKVPAEYKQKIMKILTTYTKELGINTQGYSQRAMTIVIDRIAVGKKLVLRIKLVVGEDVQRLDDGEEVFALTYEKGDISEIENMDEDIIDTVEYLLEDFKDQYTEDNEE